MSRLGRKPIKYSDKTKVEITGQEVVVKGPKGELRQTVDPNIIIILKDQEILVDIKKNDKSTRQKHGLYRSLINNMVIGVEVGYSSILLLKGIGYKVQKKGSTLVFNLGYSHPIDFKVNENIKSEVEGHNKIILSGVSKHLLGQVSADIKGLRKKDPYKGKGIYFEGEVIRKKQGKSIKK